MMQSQQSSLKNPSVDTSKQSVVLNFKNLPTYLTLAFQTARSSMRLRKVVGWTSVCMSIATLGAMIQKYYSTLFGFSLAHVGVAMSCWIISVWLSLAWQAKTNDGP